MLPSGSARPLQNDRCDWNSPAATAAPPVLASIGLMTMLDAGLRRHRLDHLADAQEGRVVVDRDFQRRVGHAGFRDQRLRLVQVARRHRASTCRNRATTARPAGCRA